MKTLIFLPLLCATTTLLAQQTSGSISYEVTHAIHIDSKGLPEGISAMLPKEQKLQSVLYFSPDAALYEYKEEEKKNETEPSYQSGNVMISTNSKVPKDKIYTDFKSKKITSQQDFMDRVFLLNSVVESRKWRFTGRQKRILELPCMEAQCVSNNDTVTAWYTAEIPVTAGPDRFSGLPGMILEIQEGPDRHMMATKIEPANDASTKMIEVPTKGKKISQEDYKKLVMEKMGQMQKGMKTENDGHGNITITQYGN